jgi:Amidase
MARTLDDMVAMENVIVGPAPYMPSSLRPALKLPRHYEGIKAWRIAYDMDQSWAEIDDEVRKNTEAAVKVLQAQGAIVEAVNLKLGLTGAEIREALFKALLIGPLGAQMASLTEHSDQLTTYVRCGDRRQADRIEAGQGGRRRHAADLCRTAGPRLWQGLQGVDYANPGDQPHPARLRSDEGHCIHQRQDRGPADRLALDADLQSPRLAACPRRSYGADLLDPRAMRDADRRADLRRRHRVPDRDHVHQGGGATLHRQPVPGLPGPGLTRTMFWVRLRELDMSANARFRYLDPHDVDLAGDVAGHFIGMEGSRQITNPGKRRLCIALVGPAAGWAALVAILISVGARAEERGSRLYHPGGTASFIDIRMLTFAPARARAKVNSDLGEYLEGLAAAKRREQGWAWRVRPCALLPRSACAAIEGVGSWACDVLRSNCARQKSTHWYGRDGSLLLAAVISSL